MRLWDIHSQQQLVNISDLLWQMLSKQENRKSLSSKSKLPSIHSARSVFPDSGQESFHPLTNVNRLIPGPCPKIFPSQADMMERSIWSHTDPGLIISHVTDDALCNFTGRRFYPLWNEGDKTSPKNCHDINRIEGVLSLRVWGTYRAPNTCSLSLLTWALMNFPNL